MVSVFVVSDFEAKLQMMGFEMEGDTTASVDLTPYKERDRARKLEQEVSAQRSAEGKPPLPPTATCSKPTVQVEERKITTVSFDDKETVKIHR